MDTSNRMMQPREKTKPTAGIWLNPDGFNNQELTINE